MKRSDFLRKSSLLAGGFLAGAGMRPAGREVTILFTNDTHGRIEPFPVNDLRHPGLGGVSRRSELIRQIRRQSYGSLLLDAGDAFSDSPPFRLLGAERMMQLMTLMGYDAMCPGEQEFLFGMDRLASAASSAGLPLLAANYRVLGTPLEDVVKQSIIRETGGIRFGIFGIGLRLEGEVDRDLYEGIRFGDPVGWAGAMARHLKKSYHCDYIICLSHLGFRYEDERIDDCKLASRVNGIDLIIGGHTHTFLDEPVRVRTPEGRVTLVTQAGHSGVRLGRIDLVRGPDGGIRERISGHWVGEER